MKPSSIKVNGKPCTSLAQLVMPAHPEEGPQHVADREKLAVLLELQYWEYFLFADATLADVVNAVEQLPQLLLTADEQKVFSDGLAGLQKSSCL
ncbi:MAG: hypothetical protein RLZZ70_247 [Candidatus Parcubacteria bacterium]|jgi:hypothetical protein